MSNSLKKRLIIKFSLTLFIIISIFGILFYYLTKQNFKHKIIAQLRESALEMEGKVLGSRDIIRNGVINIPLPPNIDIALLKNGKIVAKSKGYRHKLCKALENSNEEFLLSGKERLNACYWERFSSPFNGAVIIQKRGIFDENEEMGEIFIGVIIPLFAILIFMAYRLIESIFRPIEELTEAIDRVSVDNFSSTISIPQDDSEIRHLVDAYNSMILRLREGVEMMERFNSDIAHEIRTPLTVIQGEAEFALRRDREAKEYIESLHKIYTEAKNLQKMSDSMLLISRYNKENIKDSFTTLQLDKILEAVIDSFSSDRIKSSIDEVEYIGNETLIRAVFINLIDNALKYSKDIINISLKSEDDKIIFSVEDRGIGIESDKLHKITDRFYRIDSSRNRAIRGFGLGLSIVNQAVSLHSAEFEIDSVVGEGTKVTLILYRFTT